MSVFGEKNIIMEGAPIKPPTAIGNFRFPSVTGMASDIQPNNGSLITSSKRNIKNAPPTVARPSPRLSA